MKMKCMLRKLFSNYGLQGAKAPSLRGCYETPVPIAAITRLKSKKNIVVDRKGRWITL